MKSYVTSADQDLTRGQDSPVQADGTFDAIIPARSVVTLNGDIVKAQKKPDAPEIISVKPLNKGLQVEFQAPKGAYEYVVRYGLKNDIKEQKLTMMSTDSFVLQGLKNGEQYNITIQAGNENGFGPPSKRAYGTPELLAPAGISAQGGDGSFTVTYKAETGIPAYRVRYGTQPGKYDAVTAQETPSGVIHVDGLVNGNTYYGVVEAIDGQAISPPSAEFEVKADVAAPSKIIAVAGDRKATLAFSPVEGATGYSIQVVSGTENAEAIQSAKNSIELTGLTNGSPVVLRVRSIGKGGNGTGYAEATVTPKAEEVRLEDDFDSGDMTRYQQDVSQWVMENGMLKQTSGSNSQGELGVKQFQIIDGTITAVAMHATTEADWGIAFRGASYGKGYLFGYENGSLVIRRDGQNLAAPTPFTAKLGELYKLEVRLNGKRIQALMDGQLIYDLTDTVYTSGQVGLHSWSDAQFAYLKVAREVDSQSTKPEIYQVIEGDGQVALHYSEVDGANSYAIRYALNSSGTDAGSMEVPAKPGSSIVTGLSNGSAYSFTVVAKRSDGEAVSEPVEATPITSASQVLFYVDAGDGTPGQLEDGEVSGFYQSNEEQPYGIDPVTGINWGYQADDGLTWANTSATDAYDSIRQYDGNENGKGLAYRFQLPNGTYKVTIGFFDPWNASDRKMNITINGETKLSNYVIGSKRESQTFDSIAVNGGELIVKAVKVSGSKPMLSWIKIEK